MHKGLGGISQIHQPDTFVDAYEEANKLYLLDSSPKRMKLQELS